MVKVAVARGHGVISISRAGQTIAEAAWVYQARWVSVLLSAKTVSGTLSKSCRCAKASFPPVAVSSLPARPSTGRANNLTRRKALVDREKEGPKNANGRTAQEKRSRNALGGANARDSPPLETEKRPRDDSGGANAGESPPPETKPSAAERRQKRRAAAANGSDSPATRRGRESERPRKDRGSADVEWVSDAVSGGLRARETFEGDVRSEVSRERGRNESASSGGVDSRGAGAPGGEGWVQKAIRGGLREEDVGVGLVLSEEALRERAAIEGWEARGSPRGGPRGTLRGNDDTGDDIEGRIREADARVAALRARHARCQVLNPGVLEVGLHPLRGSLELTRRGTREGEVGRWETRAREIAERESVQNEALGGSVVGTGRSGSKSGFANQEQEATNGRRKESSVATERAASSGSSGRRFAGQSFERDDFDFEGAGSDEEKIQSEAPNRVSKPGSEGTFWPELDQAVSSLIRQRNPDEAIRVLRDGQAQGGKVSRRSYSWLVTLLCRQRRFATAHNWYLSLAQESGVRLDDTALAMLIQEAVRIGRKEEAWALLQVMRSYGYCPRVATWSAVVSVFSRGPESAEQALRIWEEVRTWRFGSQEVYTDTGAFNAAINACVSLRDLSRAEALWALLRTEGLRPDVLTYNIMLRGYALIGEKEELKAGVVSMERVGVRVDVSTYNTRVAGYVQLGDVAAAEGVLDEVRELAGLRKGSSDGAELAQGEADSNRSLAGLRNRSSDGAESAQGETDSNRSFAGVAGKAPNGGERESGEAGEQRPDFEPALAADRGSEESRDGTFPGAGVLETEEYVLTKSRVGNESARVENGTENRTEQGTEIGKESETEISSENGTENEPVNAGLLESRPEVFPARVTNSTDGETESADARVTDAPVLGDCEASSSDPSVSSDVSIVNEASDSETLVGKEADHSEPSDSTEANHSETSDQNPTEANDSETTAPDPTAANHSETSDPDRAAEDRPPRPWPTLSELRDEAIAGTRQRAPKRDTQNAPQALHPTVRTYTPLLRGYAKEGRLREAFDLVEEMVAAAQARPETLPNVITYTVLIDGCVRKGKLGVGRKVVEWMRRQGVSPNTVTYNTLLRGAAQARDLGGGLGIWREMEQAEVEADVVTYNTMMDLCIKADAVSEAFRWFKRLKESHIAPTVVSYTTAMRGLGLAQELGYAERLFRTMLDDTSIELDRPAFNAVIDTFCRVGAMDFAKKVFQAMKTAGITPDLATYGSLVIGFSRRENIGEVLVLWKEIRERNEAARETVLPVRRGGLPRGRKEVGTTPRGEIVLDQRLCDEVLSACVRAGYYERALGVIAVMEELGMAINRRRYSELFQEEQEKPWPSSRTQIIERSPRQNDFVEKFKGWLGLDNSYYQRDWNWRD